MEYKLTLPPSSSNMEETVSMTTIRWNKDFIVKDVSVNTKIQFNANRMNKSWARIEFVEFYTGPAFIHLVCIKLYKEKE